MEQSPSLAPPNQRSPLFRRWYFWVALGLLFVLLAALIYGVYYYRSGKFNHSIATQLEAALREYGVRAEVGGFELGNGLSSATLRDLKFYNQATGQLISTIDRAVVTLKITDLYALNLKRNVVFQRLELDKLDLTVTIDENGKSNLDGLHQAPPRAPSRITFDVNNLVGEVSNGKFHLLDKQHQLTTEIPDLTATFQPTNKSGVAAIAAKFAARNSMVNYESRAVAVGQIDFVGNLMETGADIEQLALHSQLGEISVTGKVQDWQALRYQLDTKINAELDEVASLLTRNTKVNGSAEFTGKITGAGKNYQVTGQAQSPDFTAAGIRLRVAKIQHIQVTPKDNSLVLSAQNLAAQSITGREFQASTLTVPEAQVVINTNNNSVTINARQANAGQLKLTTTPAEANTLSLQNLTAKISGSAINVESDARLGNASVQNINIGATTGKLSLTPAIFSLGNFTTAIFWWCGQRKFSG